MTTPFQRTVEPDYVDLHFVSHRLLEKKELILGTGLLFFLFAFFYSLYQPTKYQANLLLQIHQNRHHTVTTQSQPTQLSALDNLPEQSLSMQVALIRSKFILLPVIHSLGLMQHSRKTESAVLHKMQTRLSILDLSNSTENNANKAGIIQISYIGEDPLVTSNVLNEIARILQQKNREYKILEIEKKLAFLKQELPLINLSLHETETQLNRYKFNTGKMNIPLQTHYLMSRLSDLDKQLQELRFKRSDLLQQYTARYPLIEALSQKIADLEKERLQTYNELKKLPAEDQFAETLIRDMHIKNKLYLAVLNQIHELEVAKAGVISDIHVLVCATPPDLPLSSHRGLIAVFGLLAGFILASLAIMAQNIFSRRIQDPFWIERTLQIQHIATIPQNDLTREALCYLRTYLKMHRGHLSSSIINFIGVDQNVGQTLILSQLAILLAQLGEKVLLIDANLRRSDLHHHFSVMQIPGLSDILSDRTKLENALVQSKISPSLHFLPAGTFCEHPSDLLAHTGLKELLHTASTHYSFILINSVPASFPSDCALIGTLAEINWLILGARQHCASEVILSIKRLNQLGLRLQGSIFNYPKVPENRLSRMQVAYHVCRNVYGTIVALCTRILRPNSQTEHSYSENN